MAQKDKQTGYTLIETLVALTLLFILLFLVTDLLPIIGNKGLNEIKFKAITAAKNQMQETIIKKNYNQFSKKVDKNLVLVQSIDNHGDKFLITITISNEKTYKIIHTLKAYVLKNE